MGEGRILIAASTTTDVSQVMIGKARRLGGPFSLLEIFPCFLPLVLGSRKR